MSAKTHPYMFYAPTEELEKAKNLSQTHRISTAETMRRAVVLGMPIVEQQLAHARQWEAEQAAKLRGFKV